MKRKDDQTHLSHITVEKKWLIEQIVANQKTHEETYKKALEGYRLRITEKVEKLLQAIAEGSVEVIYIKETPPTNHKREYKQVIGMLMASIHNNVILSANEFASYVQDDWHWKQEWTTSITSNMTG